MKIDLVHDIQKTYRTVLSCFASPGLVGDLSAETALLDIECPLNPGLFLLALTFLDAETTVCVLSNNSSGDERFLSRMTNTRIEGPGEAGFIFGSGDVASAILSARRGTLVDPHLGATVVIETDEILDASAPDCQAESCAEWTLTGPGIKSSARFRVSARGEAGLRNALRSRGEACGEFPLGIDLIVMDAGQKIICIPRTTIVEEL